MEQIETETHIWEHRSLQQIVLLISGTQQARIWAGARRTKMPPKYF